MHGSQVDPPWKGFVNRYEYRRGPIFNVPWLGIQRFESIEILYVYFDESGRAVRMRVHHHGLAARPSDSVEDVLLPAP
ncbi:MAG TPA: hypothetical protein PKK06_04595 [Phycisphaerae bacterium]|nr:hypothetical protein [Phycisphaerae bacterium]